MGTLSPGLLLAVHSLSGVDINAVAGPLCRGNDTSCGGSPVGGVSELLACVSSTSCVSSTNLSYDLMRCRRFRTNVLSPTFTS